MAFFPFPCVDDRFPTSGRATLVGNQYAIRQGSIGNVVLGFAVNFSVMLNSILSFYALIYYFFIFHGFNILDKIVGPQIRYADLARQDPGKARQNQLS